jgi:predicted permease
VGAEVWLGTPRQPQNQSRTAFNYRAVARVRSGVSLATATAELESLGATLAAAYPDSNAERSFSLVGLQEQLVGSSRATLWLLMAAAGLVLLIACANVANLLLARASGRAREIAVRSALGASRGRIVVQLLVESGLLALGGGLLGALLAQVVLSQLVASLPASLRQAGEIELAGGPLAFALGLCVVCVLLCGLAPAWHASRTDLRSGLSEAGARGQLGGSLAWLRSSLVVCEVGLAVLLATGAGLMLRTLVELGRAPLGFETEGRLVATLHVPAAGREEYVSVAREVFQVEETLGALPGVRSAAASMGLPSGPYGSNGAYAVEGRHSFEPGQELPQANFSLVGPGYFGTLGIPLRSGREIERGDLYHAPFVAVVSESLAHQTFPGEDPIGQRVQCGLDSLEPMTIVGVVGDVRQDSPASPPKPTLYMSLAQHPYFANEVQVVLRTEVEPSSLVSLVRDAVRRGRPDAALSFTTLSELVEGSTATPRLRGRLAALFAGVALLLAGAGIFGVMSYTTGRRQGEMALRRALGARGVDVWLLVVRSGLGLAATGMVLGFAGATAAAQLLKTVVFGIEPHDASTWLAVGAVTLAIAMAAIAAPAWRASRADPASLLRQE